MAMQDRHAQPDDMDEATAALILEIHLADTEQLSAQNQQEREGDHVSDNEIAIRMSRDEIQLYVRLVQDHHLAQAIAGGIQLHPDAAGTLAANAPTNECLICSELFHTLNIIILPCHHEWCTGCIQTSFRKAIVDEDLFPPKCCEVIPLLDVTKLLEVEVIAEFQAKSIEYGTADRIYCSNTVCSIFIPPAMINAGADVVTCPSCRNVTCTICKATNHGENDCPDDRDARQLRQLAAEEGWQRCPTCRRTVELALGCHHIRCRCGTEFCYICREIWAEPKKCRCPLWAEARLILARAVQPPRQRNMIAPIPPPACVHERFGFVRGENQCGICHAAMPDFIMRCSGCQYMLCRRCHDNRA